MELLRHNIGKKNHPVLVVALKVAIINIILQKGFVWYLVEKLWSILNNDQLRSETCKGSPYHFLKAFPGPGENIRKVNDVKTFTDILKTTNE